MKFISILCIVFWISVFIIQVAEKYGTAMCCTKGGAGDKDSFALLATGGSSLTEEKCGEVW